VVGAPTIQGSARTIRRNASRFAKLEFIRN
jgi:hypothetical protein